MKLCAQILSQLHSDTLFFYRLQCVALVTWTRGHRVLFRMIILMFVYDLKTWAIGYGSQKKNFTHAASILIRQFLSFCNGKSPRFQQECSQHTKEEILNCFHSSGATSVI